MVIDGKTMVRSRNPYYLTMPNEPEYVYTEKGKELKTLQGMIEKSIAKRLGLTTTSEPKGVPEAKVKEMARQEVDRILREQGLKGFYRQGQRQMPWAVVGRYVGVYPNPDNPPGAWKGRTAPWLATLAAVALPPGRRTSRMAGPGQGQGVLIDTMPGGGRP